MIEVQHRIEIDSSPPDVFAYLAEVERLPDWQASVIAVRRATPGPLRLGSEFEQTWKAMGRRRRVPSRIAAHKPDELIAIAGDAGFLDYYCGFELTPTASGGTTLASRSEFRLHGLWKLLQPVIGGELRSELVREIAELKRVIEANTRTHPAHAS